MDLFKTVDLVHQMLIKYPITRDDDKKLTANIWIQVLRSKKIEVKKISGQGFLAYYVQGLLPNHDHITRTRRKLQEEHPELRGKLWKKRHQIAEEVRTNMHTAKLTL